MDPIAQPDFEPHGTHALKLVGRILVAHVRGPWNEEAVRLYQEEMAACVAHLAGAPWGLLAFTEGMPLHTPASERLMVTSIQAHRLRGRRATAVVMETTPGMLQKILQNMYDLADEPCAFFATEAEGLTWLNELLARAE